VQHIQGAGANNLVVAMKDHLVMFDAPYGEAQSRMAIDLAKAKYPGKPVKYLIQTHHHMDHSGGLRTYVAEGATIVVAAPTRAYFNKAPRNPRTVANDEQQRARKPLRITEVKDQLTLKDDAGGEIRIYNIKNPHTEGYLLGHVVKENVVFVTDLGLTAGSDPADRGQPGRGRGAQEVRHQGRRDRRRPRHHCQAGRQCSGAGAGGVKPLMPMRSADRISRRPERSGRRNHCPPLIVSAGRPDAPLKRVRHALPGGMVKAMVGPLC